MVLIPGSSEALHTDADELETVATTLDGYATDIGRHVVPNWIGSAAAGWSHHRATLTESLGVVAETFRVAASVLRAHASTLTWARERAAVAVDLWQSSTYTTPYGGAPLAPPLRSSASASWSLQPAVVSLDPYGLRPLAEALLADARAQVRTSAEVTAAVLDELCADLPDGQWRFDQFFVGVGRWIGERAKEAPVVRVYRVLFEYEEVAAESQERNEALRALWDAVQNDPDQVVPLAFDTQTLEDNPGLWWGGQAPDAALSLAGVGAVPRALRVLDAVPPTVRPPRVFTSSDPLVGDLATMLDAHQPGLVRAVNVDIRKLDGDFREVDIDLGDTVVQVKGGNARGLIGQMQRTLATTDRAVIGYAPGMKPGALADAARQGLAIARTPEELIAMIGGAS